MPDSPDGSAFEPSRLQAFPEQTGSFRFPIGSSFGFLILRLALASALFCVLFFNPLAGIRRLLWAMPALYAAASVGIYWLRKSERISEEKSTALFFVDLAACLIAILAVEGAGNGLYTVLLLLILASTFLKRPAVIFTLSAGAAIVYGLLVMPPFPFTSQTLIPFYQHLSLFILITLFGVHIADYAAVIERQTAARYEERLAWMQRLSMVGRAMAAVLHEAKTPLGTILLNAEAALEKSRKGENPADELEMISDETHQATTILQNFLDFVKPSELDLQPVRVHEPLLQSLDMSKIRLDERRIELNVATLNDCAIRGSHRHLIQVFSNLVNNAVDAMPEGGKLKVWMERRGLAVRVCFEDTGVGMTQEVRDHLFEPFATSKLGEQGHGLGLAIVRWIVLGHKGDIEIKSDGPGRGSLVSVSFPLSV